MGERGTEYRVRTEKWAAISTTVQATVAMVATAWVAYAEAPPDGATVALVSAIVTTVGGVMAIVGRFYATGGLTLRPPPKDQVIKVEIPAEVKRTGRIKETRSEKDAQS